jgi:hypothetical protein
MTKFHFFSFLKQGIILTPELEPPIISKAGNPIQAVPWRGESPHWEGAETT